MWRVGFGLAGLVGETGFGAWGLNMLQDVSARGNKRTVNRLGLRVSVTCLGVAGRLDTGDSNAV